MSENSLVVWQKLHDPVEPAIAMWFVLTLASLAGYGYIFEGAPAAGTHMYILRVPLAVCLLNFGLLHLAP